MKDNMHMVNVSLENRSYEIVVAPGGLRNLAANLHAFAHGRTCLIITDCHVENLYARTVTECMNGSDAARIETTCFPAGEQNKNLATIGTLLSTCCEVGLDRSSLIIALGGGVPGDIAGFVAAIYMRGLPFVQIPTTLLAMVDSSVGGKTGVDLPQGKNLVGAFWQPRFVMIDPEFLRTLPEREIRCGLAEIVKYGVILDVGLFSRLEENIEAIRSLDLDFYSEIIAYCCRLKAHVVTQDEREGGLRAILNYGHTFGHAIEQVTGFTAYAHGEAVAIGMAMAMQLAVDLGMCDASVAGRQRELLQRLGLPVNVQGAQPEAILQGMNSDKKKEAGRIKLILPEGIGHVVNRGGVDPQCILAAIRSCCR